MAIEKILETDTLNQGRVKINKILNSTDELINNNSPFRERNVRSTTATLEEITSAGDAQQWTFEFKYPEGFVTGVYLKINSSVDENYTLTAIGSKTNKILRVVKGTGHGKVAVPLNGYFEESFYLSIKCKNFGYKMENNGYRFSIAAIPENVGDIVNIDWKVGEYDLGAEIVYTELDLVMSNLQKQLTDLNSRIPIGKQMIDTDFDSYSEQGGYWVEKLQSDSKPDLSNAPENATFGGFALFVNEFGKSGTFKMVQQIAQSYSSQVGNGVWARYVLFNQKDGSVNKDNTAIRKWMKLTGSNQIEDVLKYEKKKLIAAGDSITAGHPYESNEEIAYVNQFARRLHFDVTRSARNGSGLLYIKGGTNAITIAENTDYTQYDVATFAFGTNDYGNDMPLGQVGDSYPTNRTIYGAIDYIIRKVYEKNPRITLVFIQPINRCDKGTLENNWAYGTANNQGYTLKDVCTAIQNVCDKYGVASFDNFSGTFNKMTIPYLLVDRLHPTEEGYKALGQMYSSKLSSIINPYVGI